jgi:hypothetical protein
MKVVRNIERIKFLANDQVILESNCISEFNEQETKVIITTPILYPELARGLCCDVMCYCTTQDIETADKQKEAYIFQVKDVVLMHVGKKMSADSCTVFELVFYK